MPDRRAALVLIDGEHYPNVVTAALEELSDRYEFRGALFLGGTEKIEADDLRSRAQELYGLPTEIAGGDYAEGLDRALERFRPEVVVDASDEPVIGYVERFRLVSHALAQGVTYEGSDFRFTPPRLERIATHPSLSIIGTAKRVGKTAVSGFVARNLRDMFAESSAGEVVIVPMGRGGPPEPEVIEGISRELRAKDLLAWSREGRHAASDHFEDAVISRVTTVGCRRCGGGLAGEPLSSNVREGALVANALAPELIIFEGSGAAIPPVETDARLLLAGAHQPVDYVTGYLGTYRILISDLVVLAMAEEPLASKEKIAAMIAAIRAVKPGLTVVPVVFRPQPATSVAGRRVAVFSTAPEALRPRISAFLEQEHGAEVVAYSRNLSDRSRLREDLDQPGVKRAEIFLTEIKAAAVDVVAEAAEARGREVVFMDNLPVEVEPARPGELAKHSRALGRLAAQRFKAR